MKFGYCRGTQQQNNNSKLCTQKKWMSVNSDFPWHNTVNEFMVEYRTSMFACRIDVKNKLSTKDLAL